ncbi:MYPU_1760 family metalloprotease [Mycoplasma buteonis]|uniref:MYPU_1760 family metalloprotease n=1 Tax=Mycoplasma buteonis TaxID=171280 RepID=UPI0005686CB4|nr:hypothetical protein [Mycoplasma buteonis]
MKWKNAKLFLLSSVFFTVISASCVNNQEKTQFHFLNEVHLEDKIPKSKYIYNEVDFKNKEELQVTTNSGEFITNKHKYKNENGALIVPFDEKHQPRNYDYKYTKINPLEYSATKKDLKLHDKNLNELNKVGEVQLKKDKNNISYYEYIDPYINLAFRDYPKEINKQKIYFLGPKGLIALAQEFKRKVPFGPEIKFLKAINFNGGSKITDNVNGLYITNINQIFINTVSLFGTNLDLYGKIAQILPTVFHEYMHHWANSYITKVKRFKVNNKNLNNAYNQEALEDLTFTYQAKLQKSLTYQEFWNQTFSNNFIKLLNYDFDYRLKINDFIINNIFNIKDDYSKFINQNFTLAQLFNLANFKSDKTFSKDEFAREFFIDARLQYANSLSDILYYYSMTELVPREYTKYGYESYYNIDETRTNEIFTNQNDIIVSSWFGSYVYNPFTRLIKNVIPSTNNVDWSRTYLNGLSNPHRQGNFIQNALMYPNTVFEIPQIHYEIEDKLNKMKIYPELPENRRKNRSIEFYQTFLQAMGYGKSIALAKMNNNNLVLSGYLKNNNFKALVLTDEQNRMYKIAKLHYNSIFNFFGHYNFDEGARLYQANSNELTPERKNQLDNRLYPLNKYFSYFTDDIEEVKDNSKIYFWNDLNNNNEVEANELVHSKELSLPENRIVYTENKDNFIYVTKNQEKETVIRIGK